MPTCGEKSGPTFGSSRFILNLPTDAAAGQWDQMPSRTTTSFDGVRIAYTEPGTSETALLFIRGGMSDRSFWDG